MNTLTALRPITRTSGIAPAVRLAVEYWTVTMDDQGSCGACDQTLDGLTDVVNTVRPLAQQLGITIEVQPRAVTTWAEAVDHGVMASPTIRAAGLEVRPTHTDGTETRVWTWRGTTALSASPEALLDFLIQALAARSQQLGGYLASGGPEPYVRQFLRAAPVIEAPVTSGCCGPACG